MAGARFGLRMSPSPNSTRRTSIFTRRRWIPTRMVCNSLRRSSDYLIQRLSKPVQRLLAPPSSSPTPCSIASPTMPTSCQLTVKATGSSRADRSVGARPSNPARPRGLTGTPPTRLRSAWQRIRTPTTRNGVRAGRCTSSRTLRVAGSHLAFRPHGARRRVASRGCGRFPARVGSRKPYCLRTCRAAGSTV